MLEKARHLDEEVQATDLAARLLDEQIGFATTVVPEDHHVLAKLHDKRAHLPQYVRATQQLLTAACKDFPQNGKLSEGALVAATHYDLGTYGRASLVRSIVESLQYPGYCPDTPIQIPTIDLKANQPGTLTMRADSAKFAAIPPGAPTAPVLPVIIDKRISRPRTYVFDPFFFDKQEIAAQMQDILTNLSLGRPLKPFLEDTSDEWLNGLTLPRQDQAALQRCDVMILSPATDSFTPSLNPGPDASVTLALPANPLPWVGTKEDNRRFVHGGITSFVRTASRIRDFAAFTHEPISIALPHYRAALSLQAFMSQSENRDHFGPGNRTQTADRIGAFKQVLCGETSGLNTFPVQGAMDYVTRAEEKLMDSPYADQYLACMDYLWTTSPSQ